MKVKWTKTSQEDLEAAFLYITKENPNAVREVGERLISVLNALTEHPNIGRVGKVEGTREFVLTGTPYVVVYVVQANTLTIISFLHSSRRWPPFS